MKNTIKAITSAIGLILNKPKAGINSWYSYRRTFLKPESEYKRTIIRNVQSIYQYENFVETGTYLGGTPLFLQKEFKKIYTIELSEELFLQAKKNLGKYNNIIQFLGDSTTEIKKIVPELDKPTIFFLDGHYSEGNTALGEKLSPIIEELNSISNSKINDHIIIIDDMSDFCAKENNELTSTVMLLLEKINPNYKFYFDYDMLFALPYENKHRQFWREIAPPFVIR